ncbi:uncharacterized protein tp53i13 isoform X2 [Betta splendens]|uniref:Uncharacterized protein tp53i13 isoform X2 n=1 Tax=Betta splendens TaxID=158456 RepID=A0A6P7P6I0_BETSP|nr:uncharacterized protein tp53i13 isoform X2 [Betta splendens]
MPGQSSSSPQLTVTVLAALWVSLGRCGGASESARPAGCDSGKLSLDVDLPAAAAYWDCPVSTWPESTQKQASVDTLHDAQPARQLCMDTRISYSHTIPSSGAYRPVMAQSGEYLYCPPQRWLNNLHHGGTVLLYHPCSPPRERLSLSALARSCLRGYVVTPHPQLRPRAPIALVSWGRTLELSTAASLDVCVWLEATTSTEMNLDEEMHRRSYNLLLVWPAEQRQLTHWEKNSTHVKASLRRCCERTISSLLNGEMATEPEADMEKKSSNHMKDEAKSRHIRAAIRETKGNLKDENESRRKEEVQNTLGQLANITADLNDEAPAVRDGGPDLLKQSDKASDKHSVKQNNSKAISSKDDAAKSKVGDNEVIEVKERELEQKQTHKRENTGSDSSAQPQPQPDQKTPRYMPNRPNCGGCRAGEPCECSNEARPAGVAKGFPRTPRTDEAVWAAGALGFLLVLLTLSVLHTRLYRHWRTMPSLYWHDPRQDYDSVADVIRRRLRIAKRRRKRGRRQECVLLPSSSSSDEPV